MKKALSTFIFVLSFGIFLFFISDYLMKNKESNLSKYGLVTNGEVITIKIGYIDYSYTVDMVLYKNEIVKPYPSIRVGEVFKVRYNSKNIDEADILLTHPIIIDSLFEKTYSQSCDFILFEDKGVQFTYQVREEEYERMQFFSDKIEVDKNKKYLIKYKKDNPKIGYIFLDKWKE